MKKFIIFICFLTIFNFSNAISNDTYDMIYDILVDIMEGMAANETYPICSIKFKEYKEDALEIFKQLIDFFIEGKSPDWIPLIMLVGPLMEKMEPCNVLDLILFILDLLNYDVKLIQNVGLNFMKKPLNISNDLDLFFNNFSFEYIGKALSLAFNRTI